MLFALPAVSQATSSSAVSSAAPTASQCETEWGKSEADDGCQNESVTVDGVMCRVEAECPMEVTQFPSNDTSSPEGTYSSTSIQATLDEVASLYNCGSVLTVGSC